MCGIAGIITPRTAHKRDLLPDLDRLRLSLARRGPDDSGLWVNATGHAGLAHTRLSILDLSAAGHQPMLSADESVAISFNGEIYNFKELRGELEAAGYEFKTGTDTEVLLRLYERDGTAMVQRLRGMFAFAIWDEVRGTCLLARDPLGIKPLYYTLKDGGLAFASELRALRSAGLVSHELDEGALVKYFKKGSVSEPLTLLRDARCLEAGHTLEWSVDGRVEMRRYWNIEFPQGNDCSASEAAATVREALLDSVRAHFVSDVPVGVFLSGGIDSTLLVALAREIGQKDLATFSIGVDDQSLDESSVAARTARHFDTDHHEMLLTGERAQQQFGSFLECMDQPSIDGLNTFVVSSFAREQGMKVVLSGLGGDEMFAGYASFDQVPRMARGGKLLGLAPELARWLGRIMEARCSSSKLRRLGSFFQQDPTVVNAYKAFRGIFSDAEAVALAASYAQDHSPGAMSAMLSNADGLAATEQMDVRDAVSACELSLYMRNQLLKDSDVMSMAHGLELRVPFVDRVLFEKVAQIPAALRLRQGKRMLLDAVPEVPEWVANQVKRGFVFPFENWLEANWGKSLRDVDARLPSKRLTWYQRWSIFMLDQWLSKG